MGRKHGNQHGTDRQRVPDIPQMSNAELLDAYADVVGWHDTYTGGDMRYFQRMETETRAELLRRLTFYEEGEPAKGATASVVSDEDVK